MENAVESIVMAVAVIVLVMALSMTMVLLSKAMTTTQDLVYQSDKTNYYDNIKIEHANNVTTRNVGIDTVITSIYRYYKENYTVKLYNETNQLVQLFDTTIEGKVYSLSSKMHPNTAETNFLSNYNDTNYADNKVDLFTAPWMGNTNKDAKTRIDLYVSGQDGFINGKKVEYKGKGLYDFFSPDSVFEETFIQYMYKGQTISTPDGIETITGNTSEKDKIVIIYKEI